MSYIHAHFGILAWNYRAQKFSFGNRGIFDVLHLLLDMNLYEICRELSGYTAFSTKQSDTSATLEVLLGVKWDRGKCH